MIENLKKNFEVFNKKFVSWPNNNRDKFFKKFIEMGFPNNKIEDWKFSNFNNFVSKNFKSLNTNVENLTSFKFDKYINSFDHNKIIFVNGEFKDKNFGNEEKEKFACSDLKGFGEHLRLTIEDECENSLNLLNNAFYLDGLSLIIEKEYEFKKPLIIYNVFKTKKENNFFNQKIKIKVGENSKIDILLLNINLGSEPIFLNIYNNLSLKKDAVLKLYSSSDLGEKDIFYNFNNVDVLSNSIFENFIFSNSANFYKNEIKCSLNEKYSSSFINGAIFSQNEQTHEIKSRIEHNDEYTKSYQKIKSVLDKKSKSVFQGKIFVDSKAQKTDGYQLSKAILLDEESEFDSKPELEIYADDVKCSHGSTSGNLDEDTIFYLMSRGLSEFDAKKLLIKGFLNDAVETITNNEIKKYFSSKIESKINEYR